MKNNTQKSVLFFFLSAIIAFPMLQHGLSFYESGKVNGAVKVIPDMPFSLNHWWNGGYQINKNAYLNDNTGCRPDLVRLNNQLDYWFFDKLHAKGVVIGKENCLYEKFYIDEYYGLDFLGDDVVRDMVVKFKKVQDTLERLGKTFVFIHAPSKAWYFPDKFPPPLEMKQAKHATNYEVFIRLGDSVGLKQVDFNAWFMGMKDTSRHLLFSGLGTHWTTYGSLIASDSIIKYIERARGIKMPELQWKDIVYNERPQRADADLEQGLNLITHFKRERFSYPQYSYSYEGQKTMPKAIFIGDSFLWILLDNRLMQSTSKEWKMWYYFNVIWSENTLSGKEATQEINDTNWQSDLLNSDYVLMLYTPANIKGFTYDGSFVEKAYRYFYPDKKQ